MIASLADLIEAKFFEDVELVENHVLRFVVAETEYRIRVLKEVIRRLEFDMRDK